MIKSLTIDLYQPLWTDLPGGEPTPSGEAQLGLRLPLLNLPLAAANVGSAFGDDDEADDRAVCG